MSDRSSPIPFVPLLTLHRSGKLFSQPCSDACGKFWAVASDCKMSSFMSPPALQSPCIQLANSRLPQIVYKQEHGPFQLRGFLAAYHILGRSAQPWCRCDQGLRTRSASKACAPSRSPRTGVLHGAKASFAPRADRTPLLRMQTKDSRTTTHIVPPNRLHTHVTHTAGAECLDSLARHGGGGDDSDF